MRWFTSLFLDDAATPGAAAPVAGAEETPGGGARQDMAAAFAAARQNLTADGTALHVPGTDPAPIVDPAAPVVVDPAAPIVDPAAPPAEPAVPPVVPPANDEVPVDNGANLTVVFPGQRTGEAPLEIDFPDQESADRVRGALNNGMRTEELRRQVANVDRQRAELDYTEDLIRMDPVGFALERVPEDLRLEMAMTILAEDGALEKVKPMLEKWEENAQQRVIDRLEAERQRTHSRQQINERVQASRDQRQAVATLVETVDSMQTLVPSELQHQFGDDLLRDMQEYARANPKAGRLPQEQIVKILHTRLRVYGVTPEQALAAIKSPASRGLPSAQPKGEAATRIAAQVAEARSTGDALRAQANVRRVAANVPSPGNGGAPPALNLPTENMQARIARVRAMHPNK